MKGEKYHFESGILLQSRKHKMNLKFDLRSLFDQNRRERCVLVQKSSLFGHRKRIVCRYSSVTFLIWQCIEQLLYILKV
jgi:hypothetical protein